MLLINRLKELRLQNHFVQDHVADLLNVSVPAYSKMETGKTDLNYSRLKALAAIYHISMIQLFTSEEKLLSGKPTALETILAKLFLRQQEINSLREQSIKLYEILKLKLEEKI
ncbi:MAG: helix-turn-helix domain-containing protein [Janthinobacterium lividum]